jgi:16S rRNA processing protein RimM
MTDAAGAPTAGERMVVLGRLAAPWGIKGWLKVHSYTDPPAAILDYPVWQLARPGGGWQPVKVLSGRTHGGGSDLVVALEGVSSPEAAREFSARDVGLRRTDLPVPKPGEYYWDDLVGCRVATLTGADLGVVSHFHDFPAAPVMAVKGSGVEHWVPLSPGRLKEVDLGAKRLVVDWDPEV